MKFSAVIEIIGINPFVYVPDAILELIFQQAGKRKGPIPIRGLINGQPYRQTLVKYGGAWRLYINTRMLKDSPNRVGELIEISIELDRESREIEMPTKFREALAADSQAKSVFEQLPPSRALEIVRYLAQLKTEESLDRNVKRAIDFLKGNGRFVGRDKP
ncbi:YdeI/OmpD-associated family protein [Pedobacter sp. SYSU D00535]|uniref:YdeI/OmpD-associated family protein n=1 Tax=Pedobacter sp. SYSU D00535 TaxID=2810308 RepID=UPI001A96E959|nr:YdeI/OmpD-associated family protein [Pedobacter sp. SYSU D00535]